MIDNGLPPIHPGEFLAEILEELEISQAQFARAIDVSPMRVSHIINLSRPVTAELALRPWRDWLRTYRGNERGDHYLAAPGSQDITTDVPFDQLPATDTLRSQAQFLQRWGIADLVEEGKRIWDEQAARPGLEAMKMRSRVSEAEALLDPGGLGSFLVAEWRA